MDFQWRGKVETFPRVRGETIGNGIQLTLGIARQVRAFEQILTQQPVGVLIGPALPRAIGIGEEDLERKALGQAFMLGYLFSAIIGRVLRSSAGTPRIGPSHPGQNDPAGRVLHQNPDGRAIACTLDQVAFPVARHDASHYVGRAFGNRRHIGGLATSIRAARSRPTRLVRLTLCRQQCAPQHAPWQPIQRRIDGFRREVLLHVARIHASEAASNLLR
jgi:hypothetical protein